MFDRHSVSTDVTFTLLLDKAVVTETGGRRTPDWHSASPLEAKVKGPVDGAGETELERC